MVIIRCDVKLKSGLHATIFRHNFILESKKKCYVGPDRHLTNKSYTAVSRKVVAKSARDNPERYCGCFEFTVLQRNLEKWHERPWTYV